MSPREGPADRNVFGCVFLSYYNMMATFYTYIFLGGFKMKKTSTVSEQQKSIFSAIVSTSL